MVAQINHSGKSPSARRITANELDTQPNINHYLLINAVTPEVPMSRRAAAQQFASKVPHLSPRVFAKGSTVRVYLTEPGHRRDSGCVDFTRDEAGTVGTLAMSRPHAAAVRLALGRGVDGDVEIASSATTQEGA